MKTETECQDGLDNDKGRNRQTIDNDKGRNRQTINKHKGRNRQTIDKHKGKHCFNWWIKNTSVPKTKGD